MSVKRPVFKIKLDNKTFNRVTSIKPSIKPSSHTEYAPQPTKLLTQRNQLGSCKFRFDIIYLSNYFKKLLINVMHRDLIRDICDESLSDLTPIQLAKLPLEDYLKIVQKSKTWFYARGLASGTASVVGKNCYLPKVRYPTPEQCEQAWIDLINKKPFVKTHAMRGHMKWGVGHEDPALVHFADATNLGVIQVGTIHLPLDVVYQKGRDLFGEDYPDCESTDDYLLVSPDGVVGIPEPNQGESRFRKLYNTLVGMLEIKCISPFHHLETDDKFLIWVQSLDKRQWTDRNRIPLVYIVQMALQALAGNHRLQLNTNASMWFLRWCPNHYVIYKFGFLRLFQLGCWVIKWYHSVYTRRIKTNANTSPSLTPVERKCQQQSQHYYDLLLKEADYTYTTLDCYPEFNVYRDTTRDFKFVVEESDKIEFGLGHALPSDTTHSKPSSKSSSKPTIASSTTDDYIPRKKKRFRGFNASAHTNVPTYVKTNASAHAKTNICRKPRSINKSRRKFMGTSFN